MRKKRNSSVTPVIIVWGILLANCYVLGTVSDHDQHAEDEHQNHESRVYEHHENISVHAGHSEVRKYLMGKYKIKLCLKYVSKVQIKKKLKVEN